MTDALAAACYLRAKIRLRLAALEPRLLALQVSGATVLLTILTVVLLACAYGVDVLLLQALVEFVVSLSAGGMEREARWVVPGLVLGLEVFVSVGRATEQGVRWLVLGALLILVQPLAGLTQYWVLQDADPSFAVQNQLIMAFLLAVGLASHLAVLLNSGTHLLTLAHAIDQVFVRRRVRKLHEALLDATKDVLQHYQAAEGDQPDAIVAAELQDIFGSPDAQFTVPNPYETVS